METKVKNDHVETMTKDHDICMQSGLSLIHETIYPPKSTPALAYGFTFVHCTDITLVGVFKLQNHGFKRIILRRSGSILATRSRLYKRGKVYLHGCVCYVFFSWSILIFSNVCDWFISMGQPPTDRICGGVGENRGCFIM